MARLFHSVLRTPKIASFFTKSSDQRKRVSAGVRKHRIGWRSGRLWILSCLIVLLLPVARAPGAEAPPRLKRADSFLGIHFDFHAGKDCTEVGKNTTPEMVENIIDLVHPDYLQIDCKGHPGLSSYPTKVGHQAPGIIGDPLRVWREVTARRGVALYMHYSGVYERQCVAKPGWAALNADGKPNSRATSFFGPYAERLLIPQLCELAGDYGVDGAWVDGECWASVPDYSPAAAEAFRKATGIEELPRKPGDPHWFEFLQFHREAFRAYLRNYIQAVKKKHPDFQVCSNWAFTNHMAEPVSAPVDFLSGDYSPNDSVNSARLSARYLARQGKPWDLMAWSFSWRPSKRSDRRQKTAVQLQREAAVVLALGGGFQAYFKQKRDGSIYPEQMPVMAEVAAFCRARQAVCHHAMPVPQVGLLLSTADQYRRIRGLFNRDHAHVEGVLHALLESQQSVEVLGEHQLSGRLAEYPVLVVPECRYLEPEFRNSLAAYAEAGGNLLLIGPSAARLFERELGIELPAESGPDTNVHVDYSGSTVTVKCQSLQVTLPEGAKPFGRLRAEDEQPSAAHPAAAIVPVGQGRIAATFFSAGRSYKTQRPQELRRLLNDLVRELFPRPLVEVKGAGDVDVCVTRNHGKLLVNLVNTSGPHRTEPVVETIPAVGPLEVTVRLAKEPAAVTLEPGAKPVDFDFQQGRLRLVVPKLEIHDIVVIEE